MAATIILDISRLFSRRGYAHDTGIDRVERAYFSYFSKNSTHIYIVRFGSRRYFLNSTHAALALSLAVQNSNGWLDRFLSHLRLRKMAKLSSLPQTLKAFSNSIYINVGHTGHKTSFWRALKAANIRILTMIHDVIPLDFPQYSRSDKIATFKRKFQAWTRYSDLILTPSAYSKDRVRHWCPDAPQIENIKLYVEAFAPTNEQPGENAWLMLGTIEPRKNHLMVLEIWQELFEEHGENIPKLWIIGARGWLDDKTKNLLDNSQLMGNYIFEYGALADPEMKQKFNLAKGILFPSHVEGFGLPIYEAVLSGKALLASDIPAFTEALGSKSPCLIDKNDRKKWKIALLGKPIYGKVDPMPSWGAHIEKALSHLNQSLKR